MGVKDARGYLVEAAGLESLRSVSLTGGEPMLFPDLVRDTLHASHELGLEAELVSNSFFATSEAAAMKCLSPLVSLGLTTYVTSFDLFHAEFVPPERVGNAVRAALALGLGVVLKILDRGPGAMPPDETRRVIGEALDSPRLRQARGALVLAGRVRSRDHATSRPAAAWQGACDKVLRYPAVTHDGLFYACCSFGEKARLVGDATREPLLSLLHDMRGDLLLNILSWRGPAGVHGMLVERGLADPGRLFLGPCDLCTSLWEDPDLRPATASLVADLTGSLHTLA